MLVVGTDWLPVGMPWLKRPVGVCCKSVWPAWMLGMIPVQAALQGYYSAASLLPKLRLGHPARVPGGVGLQKVKQGGSNRAF